MNLIVLQNLFFNQRQGQGQLLGFHFLMPCLKMLSDVDCLRFSGTNAQIFAPLVDIDSTPKLVVLLCLRSRT